MRLSPLLPAFLLVALAGCENTTRNLQDPTVEIRTSGGTELGVSTDYGLVFLGRTARSGEIEITAWFGNGPSIEPSVVEPIGGGLFTAQAEIRLPSTTMSFQRPEPGDSVTVIGRTGPETWEREVEVRTDPRVDGLLLAPIGELSGDQVGAGVYVGEGWKKKLVGLVSGRLFLSGADGTTSEYVTVVGPDDLWRIVVYDRSIVHKVPFPRRGDVL